MCAGHEGHRQQRESVGRQSAEPVAHPASAVPPNPSPRRTRSTRWRTPRCAARRDRRPHRPGRRGHGCSVASADSGPRGQSDRWSPQGRPAPARRPDGRRSATTRTDPPAWGQPPTNPSAPCWAYPQARSCRCLARGTPKRFCSSGGRKPVETFGTIRKEDAGLSGQKGRSEDDFDEQVGEAVADGGHAGGHGESEDPGGHDVARATPQRTAESFLVAPTPMMAEVMVWVVEIWASRRRRAVWKAPTRQRFRRRIRRVGRGR